VKTPTPNVQAELETSVQELSTLLADINQGRAEVAALREELPNLTGATAVLRHLRLKARHQALEREVGRLEQRFAGLVSTIEALVKEQEQTS
jgi:predicted nuclease with TOPRIM domain